MGEILNKVKWMAPEPVRAALRSLRRDWRQWRFGKRGVPRVLCGELLRFKLGYEPATQSQEGKFWKDEMQFQRVFYHAIHAGHTVVDAGAFVGHYTLLAARRVGSAGRVLAFEPVRASRRILVEHLACNDLLDRVDVWPVAVGKSNEFVKVYFQGHDPVRGHNSTRMLPFEQRNLMSDLTYQTVPCVALGPFLEATGVKPDVVKIDIEGDEIGVLTSLADLLKGNSTVLCELHPHLWPNNSEQSAVLRDLLRETGRVAQSLDGRPVSDFKHEHVLLQRIS